MVRSEISRFSIQEACVHARVFDRAGSVERSRIALDRVAFRLHDDVGIPDQYSVAAEWLACSYLCQRFIRRLAMPDA
jgi:hypothetical protein